MAEEFKRVPPPDLLAYTSLRAAVSVAVSAGAVSTTSALTLGELYVVMTDHPCHVLQGNFTSGTVSQVQASTTDLPLGAYQRQYVWVWSDTAGGENNIGNDCVAFKSRTGASGIAWYARVNRQ